MYWQENSKWTKFQSALAMESFQYQPLYSSDPAECYASSGILLIKEY